MGRVSRELLERTETFSHRMVDVAEALAKAGRSRRVVDQLIGCGTSVGANTCEADEAMSRPEFCRILGVVVREAAESRFWIRFVAKRGWIPEPRLAGLEAESVELRKIFGSMIARTKLAASTSKRRRTAPA